MRKWTTLLLVLVCAALAFGGSFTCFASSDGDGHSSTRGSR
jgi:hypothetical protein